MSYCDLSRNKFKKLKKNINYIDGVLYVENT